MSGLTIGLAFGLAAAGGIGGYALSQFGNFAGGLVNLCARGELFKESNPGRDALIGAFAGAVLGLGIGTGIDVIRDDAPVQPVSVAEECVANAPEGKSVVLSRDSLGNPVCSYQ